jgi:hypothetical protein
MDGNSYFQRSKRIMARTTIAAVVLVAGIVAAVFTFDRAVSRMPGSPPRQRPSGIPANAVWAGGPDGGSYFRCTVDQARNINPCTIWNDETGSVILSEDFWVGGEDRAATSEELEYGWYDGLVIGLRVLTAEKKYLTLERVAGLKPITVCELLEDPMGFRDKPVAVLGRLDTTNAGKSLTERDCQAGSGVGSSVVRIIESGGPRPPQGRLYTNQKAVRAKLSILKATTKIDRISSLPIKEFQSWAVVYGRVEYDRDSAVPITLVSSGDGIDFISDK